MLSPVLLPFRLLLCSLSPPCTLYPPPCLWISLSCPPCSSPAMKPLLFSATILSGLSLYPLEICPSFVTSPPVCPVLLFPFLSSAEFSTLSTASLTLVFVLPGGWFLVPFVWSGLSEDVSDWARGCLHCQRSRFNNMFTPLFRFLFLLDGSVTFTWTWLELFLVPEVLLISSPSWTGPLIGPRLFLCHQPQLRIVLEP